VRGVVLSWTKNFFSAHYIRRIKVNLKNKFLVSACSIAFLLLFFVHTASPEDLSFCSFNSPEMIAFDLSFKQYIVSLKKDVEKEKAVKSLTDAIKKWDELSRKATGTDESLKGRFDAVKAMLLLAKARVHLGEYTEAGEISIPIRSEIYLLHKDLDTLTEEDYMIFFHNAVMHRAEPLINEGRYKELEMMIPLMKETIARFKTPPEGASDIDDYRKKYSALTKSLDAYISAIEEANDYIDPEFGAAMLHRKVKNAHDAAHEKYGAVYLSFPEGMAWPEE